MKYYSELLKKIFDSVEELNAKEEERNKELHELEIKKQMAELEAKRLMEEKEHRETALNEEMEDVVASFVAVYENLESYFNEYHELPSGLKKFLSTIMKYLLG